jgi:uncharacterized protein Yka (UPF0111/DUF47 family)
MRFFEGSESFFDQFEKHGQKTVQGCRLLLSLLGDAEVAPDIREHTKAISNLEQECDRNAHAVIAQLRETLITPLDRSDIYRLITKMDDVIDLVEAASERLALFEIRETTQVGAALGRVLLASAEHMLEAVTGFRDFKRPQNILVNCGEIARLETEADNQLRVALAKLFRNERDPIAILKWKEIYELLESATDRCEDVANIIEGVVLKNA